MGVVMREVCARILLAPSPPVLLGYRRYLVSWIAMGKRFQSPRFRPFGALLDVTYVA